MAQLKSTNVLGNLTVSGKINGTVIMENGTLLPDKYQAKLVSGSNIATINNKSLLDGGNITISGGSGGSGACVKLFSGYDLLSNFGAYVSASYNTYLITLSSAYYYELDDSGPAYLIVTKTSDSYYCMLGILMYTDTELYNIHAYCQWIGNSKPVYSDTIDPDAAIISEIYAFS